MTKIIQTMIINVEVGDKVQAGYGFRGPQKFGVVYKIEETKHSIILHTDQGIYEGPKWSTPQVIRNKNDNQN